MPQINPGQTSEGPAAPGGISVVVPCHNEARAIAPVLNQLEAALRRCALPFEIIVVDDGSGDGSAAQVDTARFRLLRHEQNLGYGAALKTGAAAARYGLIAITDADGTYPVAEIPRLLAEMGEAEMIIGARTGNHVRIQWARRPAKWALGRLANYLTGTRIPDLNSGLRIVRRELWQHFEYLFPDGFSLTTTITLAALTNRRRVRFIPIDYHTRVGSSKIRPVQDTLNFIQLILRTILYFNPMKVFLPVSIGLFLASVVIGVGTLILQYLGKDHFMDVTTSLLFIASIQMLAIGALADLISRRMK